MFKQTKNSVNRISWRSLRFISLFLSLFSVSQFSLAIVDLSQTPLFIGQSAKPVVMFAMSRDQELSYKAYPDYSNLDGGILRPKDITYRNDFPYYGYFNSNWCYTYAAATATKDSYFQPAYAATKHKCNQIGMVSAWSGNFLNWATMTRIDILRKVLFGGKRAVDSAKTSSSSAVTILERAYLPKDSHAFAKVYNSGDGPISDYTPYSDATSLPAEKGITICNVSTASNGYPVIRVAKGVWNNWSHTEIQQCQWRSTSAEPTKLDAARTTSPAKINKLDELVAKVSVCVPEKDVKGNIYNPSDEEAISGGCLSYESDSYKPVGVLQKKYDSINFGLVSGSWGAPGSGGVLRKKAGPIAGQSFSGTDTVNEFSTRTGVFNSGVQGIIHSINSFKINNYTFSSTSGDVSYSGDSDWRNPIGEIYAETLRYLIGKKDPEANFAAGTDLSTISKVSSWDDPISSESWCTKCSIIVLSSGPNSEDGDYLDNAYLSKINAGLDRAGLDDIVDLIIAKNEFKNVENALYVGRKVDAKNGDSLTDQCSAATVKLSSLRGSCPEFPTSKGTYSISGLAYYANRNDLRPSMTGTQSISTYAVELSEGLPTFTIPVSGAADAKKISIVPICTNGTLRNSACSLVGVRVEQIENDASGTYPVSGKYLFYWEDQPWASDYDMDAVQRIHFCVGPIACKDSTVGSSQIKITNTIPYWATGTSRMDMSFIIQGIGPSGTYEEITDKEKETKNIVNGPQHHMWVHRGGYDTHNIMRDGVKVVSSLDHWSWYNAMDDADPLPLNTASSIYNLSHIYNFGSDELAKSLTNLKTPLFYAAKYGKFDDNEDAPNGLPDETSEWDKRNTLGGEGADGLPDNYFLMKNPALLEAGIINMIKDIAAEGASGAGVATNSTRLDDGTFVYQALFNTDGWHGEIAGYSASTTSDKSFTKIWSTRGKFISSVGRNILSYNPESKRGFEFTVSSWGSLSIDQKGALGTTDEIGKNVMKWVRGENITGYRSRILKKEAITNLLGDIVNSTPVFAGDASEGHEKLSGTYGGTVYKDYLKNVKSKRLKVLYANANDGMLHAINADCTTKSGDTKNCGKEVFAYVPSAVYPKLPKIADATYGKTTPHQYLVDGPISVGDAYIKVPSQKETSWRNILVGTMGAGARGIFVLDVTNPESFSEKDVLFEITPNEREQIGNVFGRPYIAPVDGRWKIILGNGYNSKDDRAYLLVIDLEEPFTDKTKAIATNTSGSNGLAGPALYRDSLSDPIQAAYAGDRLGNMWKFDLSSFGSAASAFGSTPDFTPLFKTGLAQPITAAPTLGFKNGKSVGGTDAVMVYFGTGSYLNATDVTNMEKQSFYGIADEDGSKTGFTGRSSLHQKTFTEDGTVRDVNDSGDSPSKPDWRTKKGWYIDFPAGERTTNKAVLAYDRVIFSTLIPKTDGCSFGGTGWLMDLVGVGDTSITALNKSMLATNGVKLGNFIPGEIARLRNSDTSTSSDTLVYSDIVGVLKAVPMTGSVPGDEKGRMSWRQLQ